MAPSPPTTPHPLFPVQQVNSSPSSSSTSSSSSWSRSLPPPTSCSAALRLQCPQSLSTWIKTSPHFHFSTRVVSTYLFIFTFFRSIMSYNNLSLSLFNWSQDISSFSFSFHFSTWVMTSPYFHFHFFFNQTWVETTFHSHLSTWVRTSPHFHFFHLT